MTKKATAKKTVSKKIKPPRSAGKKQQDWITSLRITLLVILIATLGFLLGRLSIFQAQDRVLGASTTLDVNTIIELLNLERAKYGLSAITINEQLTTAAYKKGEDMIASNYWAHVGPSGTEPWLFIQNENYSYQSAGENLARDYKTETDLIAAWMASPTHRTNILNGNFSELGISVLDGVIDGKPILLVVNFFAQPRSAFGLIPQSSIYDQNLGNVVLASDFIPDGGELLDGVRYTLNDGQSLFFLGVVVISICFVLWKLRQNPYGRPTSLLKK
jgi:uncharacterized protein YkwD